MYLHTDAKILPQVASHFFLYRKFVIQVFLAISEFRMKKCIFKEYKKAYNWYSRTWQSPKLDFQKKFGKLQFQNLHRR